jgi:acyl-CoA thioester hydrolase
VTTDLARPPRSTRADYRLFRPISTRWMDNDVFGHINNVVYYSYFDTAVNAFLIDKGVLSPGESQVIGIVAETECSYFESAAFPAALEAGLGVERLGRTSVRYRIGIFREGDHQALAQGRFVHVYVDRPTKRPVEIPAAVRSALAELTCPSGAPK